MTTQAEEQLEQASAPQSYSVATRTIYGKFPEVLEVMRTMQDWCYANTGCCNWNVPIGRITPDTNPDTQAFFDVLAACKARPIFTFESELDALAFRLMFSEYL